MKPNYIDGRWVEGESAEPDINASDTSDVIDEYARAGHAPAEAAIEATAAAIPQWRVASPQVLS